MQDWLLEISQRLEGRPSSSERLISAAVIILCLQQLSSDCIKSLPIRAMRSLLRIITLSPSEDRLCPDYEHLCKFISTDKYVYTFIRFYDWGDLSLNNETRIMIKIHRSTFVILLSYTSAEVYFYLVFTSGICFPKLFTLCVKPS